VFTEVPLAAAVMETARCGAPEVMQLAVASKNLSQVLLAAVQQPEEVQEQVAEEVQKLLNSLRCAR
jgi:hypothetical protein